MIDYKTILHSSVSSHRDMLLNYVYQNCSNPQKILQFDSVQGHFVNRSVPCGSCWHCCQSKQAQMVTRMFLHNENWKYRYFVTLTYSSYTDEPTLENYALKDELTATMPIKDMDNTKAALCYSPCLLTRSHLQNYFKRLRKLTDKEISYYAVGEYGHTFGRPHYHLIVWSHEPLDTSIFTTAWGKKWTTDKNGNYIPYRGLNDQKSTFVPFGRVDIVDLLHPRYVKSSHGKSQADIFKYVAKYVNKFNNYEENDIKKTKNTFRGSNFFRVSKIFTNFAPEIIKKRYYYERNYIKHFELTPDYELSDLPRVPYTDYKFKITFAPFALSSRKNAIGKDFLLQNLESLANGLLKLPKTDSFSPTFPTYYQRKITEYRHPLRVAKNTRNGTSFALGSLPIIYNCLDTLSNSINPKSTLAALGTIGKLGGIRYKYLDKELPTLTYLYDCSQKIYYQPFNEIGAIPLKKVRGLGLVPISPALKPWHELFDQFKNGYSYVLDRYNQNREKEISELNAQAVLTELHPDLPYWIADSITQLNKNLSLHQSLYHATHETHLQEY